MPDSITIYFYCPKCKTKLEHDYTDKDIFNKDKLEFTCQKCGHIDTIKTKKVIEDATKKAIKELSR